MGIDAALAAQSVGLGGKEGARMNLVTPYARMMDVPDREAGIALLKKVEWCARISHRSEDAQTEESWERFLTSVILGHGDWSVTEHASVTVDAVVDRGITHEWVRHRLFAFTQECVTGDTRLTGNITIQQAYDGNMIGRKIRSTNGTLLVRNAITHIFDKGLAPVYQMVTKAGYRIRATLTHKFQRANGIFTPLDDLRIGDSVMVNGRPCLLEISDETLLHYIHGEKLTPQDIADREGVPYSTVTRRLRKLGFFRAYPNNKNLEKYNKNHTPESYERMAITKRLGHANGLYAPPWNKGLSEEDDIRVKRQGDALRKHHHQQVSGPENPNWKGGCRKTERETARKLKALCTSCEVCNDTHRLEVHHIDENPSNNTIENLLKLCHTCHKKVHSRFKVGIAPVADSIVSILFCGLSRVFDLEMETFHNYVADGFIVHNSTRFVNYEKRGGLRFVVPPGLEMKSASYNAWESAMTEAERSYGNMLTDSCSPQLARSALPNALASRLVTSGNLRNWRHFFLMRTSREAHPQMRQVTLPLLAEFQQKIPLLYDDITPNAKQSDNLQKAR